MITVTEDIFITMVLLVVFEGFAFMAFIAFMFWLLDFFKKFGKKIELLSKQLSENKKTQSEDCASTEN